jgi:hypothetical protein
MGGKMITPSLSFDFSSAMLDPRIAITRANATATRVNSNGLIEVVAADTPRFDYNPITLACRGLLVEELRQNLFLNSEDFAAAYWVKYNFGSVTGNQAIAPDGTNTADLLTWTSATASGIYRSIATGTDRPTMSVFAKYVSGDPVIILQDDTGGKFGRFNLSTGVTAGNTGLSAIRMVNYGSGWYRCEITFINPPSNIKFICGNGTAGSAYIWGAQLELGAFATSYIPTTTTAVTRNADVATITGTSFSDFWQASKGGVLVRARPGTVSGTRPWVQFDDNTADNIIALRGNTTNPELYIVDGGTPQAQIDAGTIAANTDYSLTGWWATNDCKARLDSGAVVTDTSATIPAVTQARLGSDGTNYLNGHLASISYYDTFSGQIYTRRKNKAVFNLM